MKKNSDVVFLILDAQTRLGSYISGGGISDELMDCLLSDPYIKNQIDKIRILEESIVISRGQNDTPSLLD